MVRFNLNPYSAKENENFLSQSHYGSIQMVTQSILPRPRMTGLNPTMVRFNSKLWFFYTFSLWEYVPISSLNPTMVRFKFWKMQESWRKGKCLNSTMVRFKFCTFSKGQLWRNVSIPLWFDSNVHIPVKVGDRGICLNSTMVRFKYFQDSDWNIGDVGLNSTMVRFKYDEDSSDYPNAQ